MNIAGLGGSATKGAIEALGAIVGANNLYASGDLLDTYRDAYSPVRDTPDERLAAAAVAPANVEQVQAIVRLANQLAIPLYPISTGRNLGYGGSAPVLRGSVVVDLKRMDRILDIDDRRFSVLVEPGVSYFDLHAALRERKAAMWLDVPDPGWGSLIGNALDRGFGFTTAPYRDHFGAHCGMEVVLPTGELVRTGMGAMSGAESWQQFRYGAGPHVDGLFSQSNFGIVTKMGFWLMPEPEMVRFAQIDCWRREDIGPLVDLLNLLQASGQMTASCRVFSPLLFGGFTGFSSKAHESLADRGIDASTAELEAFSRENDLPFWSLSLGFYGPHDVVAAQSAHAQKRLADAIAGARYTVLQDMTTPLDPKAVDLMPHQAPLGVPNLAMFVLGSRSPLQPTPTSGHIGFSPIIPMTGEAVVKALHVFTRAFKAWGIKPLFTSLPGCFHLRSFAFVFGFAVMPDAQHNARVIDVIHKLIDLAADHGWGEYRTAPVFMDHVAKTYGWNDGALWKLHHRLKEALDPKGIMAAGRYGIWPSAIGKG